jgi:hypothetical protein
MSATGRGAVRQPDDFYETPAWVTRALVPKLKPLRSRARILEPAAGAGAITGVVRKWAPDSTIYAVDIDGERLTKAEANVRIESSFLDYRASGFDLAITNPPFSLALEFIEHALGFVHTGGEVAMLLRLNFLGSKKRAPFWKSHPCDVYVIPKRPSFTGGGTDSCEYMWAVWGPGRGSRWKILDL